jgi:hypothetical protein
MELDVREAGHPAALARREARTHRGEQNLDIMRPERLGKLDREGPDAPDRVSGEEDPE